ncbi:EDS1-like protein [Tanacetum coccineum]
MNMEVDSGSVKLSLRNELINDALILSLEVQKQNEHYLTNTKRQGSSSSVSSEVFIIAFKGSREVKDWYHDDHFGETDVDQSLFPSLKRIGEDLPAKVNKAILQKFQDLLNEPGFKAEDYYDAFFGQDVQDDFLANVNRLEQAKIWDVIVEMVIRKDLPDEFEGRDEWVILGTEFRRLVEVLDIANYYRHSKGEGSKPYMSVRPKRYKFTQRWHEHANVMAFESVSESNFVAEIEELIIEVETRKKKNSAEG